MSDRNQKKMFLQITFEAEIKQFIYFIFSQIHTQDKSNRVILFVRLSSLKVLLSKICRSYRSKSCTKHINSVIKILILSTIIT